MKTLKKFLKKHKACEEGYLFAKDLTLEQFLNSCERGDWILWLFAKSNPKSIRELTLAKGCCSKTVIHLIDDERSHNAVQAAIDFGNGKISKKELNIANAAAAYAADAASDASDASAASANAAYAAAYAAYAADASAAAYASAAAAYAAYAAAANAASAAYAAYRAKKQHQKETADICRRYLPLEIWNINNR